jgi:hypothetical protein
MASRDIEKYLDDVALGSRSWIGSDALLSAARSSELDDASDDEEDFDDISSLSFSDLSMAANAFQTTPRILPSSTIAGITQPDDHGATLQRSTEDRISANEEVQHRQELLEVRLQHTQRRHTEQMRLVHAHYAQQIDLLTQQLETARRESSTRLEQLEAIKVSHIPPPLTHLPSCPPVRPSARPVMR